MIKSIFNRFTSFLLRKEPRTLIFEVTDSCNLSCKYCYRPADLNKKLNHLDLPTLKKIKKNLLSSSDIFSIGISGGEPLLNPELESIIPILLEIDPNANLLSNLSLLSHAKARSLRKAGLKGVQITIFSPLPEQHDYLRNCSDFARTMEGISCLKELDFKVEAILLVTSVNYKMTVPAMEMILSLGIESFMINRYNASFPENHQCAEDLFLDQKNFIEWLDELESFAARNNFVIPFAIPIPPCALPEKKLFPHLAFSFCPIGKKAEYLTVGPNGDLRPCNHLPVVLGNLCNETIEEILKKNSYRELLQQINTPPDFCRNCVAWNSCRGGCRGAAWSWTGSIKRHDPWLDKVRAFKLNGSEKFRPEYDKNDQW